MLNKETVISQLIEMYNGGAAYKDAGWIVVLDNHKPQPQYGTGSASPQDPSGWKVHISIHQDDMVKAIRVLCSVLLDDNSVRIGFKLVNALSFGNFEDTQPAKQIAIIFGKEVSFEDMRRTISDLNEALKFKCIQPETRALNSKHEPSKFDAQIKNDDDTPSYFGYRNDNAVVMDDLAMDEYHPTDNYVKQDCGYLVRQSYYDKLQDTQKHNPAMQKDPFKGFTLSSQKQPKRPEPTAKNSSGLENLSFQGMAVGLTVGLIGGYGLQATTAFPKDYFSLGALCLITTITGALLWPVINISKNSEQKVT